MNKLSRKHNTLPSVFQDFWDDDFFNHFIKQENLPATNVKENEAEYVVEISIPGFDKDQINIEIDRNLLKITAQKQEQKDEKDKNEKIIRQEFSSSSFERNFTLPSSIDREKIRAKQENGLLKISLPKNNIEADDIKKIDIG